LSMFTGNVEALGIRDDGMRRGSEEAVSDPSASGSASAAIAVLRRKSRREESIECAFVMADLAAAVGRARPA